MSSFVNPLTGDSLDEYFANFHKNEHMEMTLLTNNITTVILQCATDANIYGCYATNPELKDLMKSLVYRVIGANTSICNKDFLALRNKCSDDYKRSDEFFAGVCKVVDGYLDEFKKHPKENGFCENLLKSIASLKE